jgi:hypothetical protein
MTIDHAMAKQTQRPTRPPAITPTATPATYPNPSTPAFVEWVKERLAIRDPTAADKLEPSRRLGPDGLARERIAALVQLPIVVDALEDILRRLAFREDSPAFVLVRAWRLPDPPLSTITWDGINDLGAEMGYRADYYNLGEVADHLWAAFGEVHMAVGSTPVCEVSSWTSRKARWMGGHQRGAKIQRQHRPWRTEARKIWRTDPDLPVTTVARRVHDRLPGVSHAVKTIADFIRDLKPHS